MKRTKYLFVLIAIVAILACSFALVGCHFEFDGSGNFEETADGEEDAMALFDGFVEDTLANTNQIVTTVYTYGEDDTTIVETIDGDKSLIQTDGISLYYFVQDGKYMSAVSGKDGGRYSEDKDAYDQNRYAYAECFDVVIDEDDVQYHCEIKTTVNGKVGTKGATGEANATLTFTASMGDERLEVTATAKDGLVTSYVSTSTYVPADSTEPVTEKETLTFVYGTAHIELPDMSDWHNKDSETVKGEEASFKAYEKFFAESLKSTNLVATARTRFDEDDESSFVQTVDGDKCVIDREVLKLFAFVKDGKYMTGLESDEGNAYQEDGSGYRNYFTAFMPEMDEVDMLPEDASYQCTIQKIQDDTDDEVKSLVFEAEKGEESIKLIAISRNGLVTSIDYTAEIVYQDGGKHTLTYRATIVYGTAHIDLPDMSDWEDQTDNK